MQEYITPEIEALRDKLHDNETGLHCTLLVLNRGRELKVSLRPVEERANRLMHSVINLRGEAEAIAWEIAAQLELNNA